MLTLGIHDGHTATACLFENGEVLACISEERLTKEKEQSGFPHKAIEECMILANRSFDQIDMVGISSIMPQIGSQGWHEPPVYKRIFGFLTSVLPVSLLQSPKNISRIHRVSNILFSKRRKKIIDNCHELGIPKNKIKMEASEYRRRGNIIKF